MGTDEHSSDLEAKAANDAIERSGVPRDQIDLLITFTQLPDYLTLNTAAITHQKLGLKTSCISVNMDALCNSFLMQFSFAEGLIRTGQARYALLVQSAGLQHLTKKTDQNSVAFGDGATAIVVGPVEKPSGLLGRAHRTDGSYHKALVTGIPQKRWYEGTPFYHAGDPRLVRSMLTKSSLAGREVIDAALAQAGCSAQDVAFYASNQPTAWTRKVTQTQARLGHARFVDTFPWSGSVGPANIPLQLAVGEREGLLEQGDLVAVYTSGSGLTWSSLVFRWGR
jgi:3-oxoacyl-[acyl-carrier-protein] synthase-3